MLTYKLSDALKLGVNMIVIFCATACSTQSKTSTLGGLLGATSGAAIGGIADPGNRGQYRTRNVAIGAAIGGVAGLIAGSAYHNEIKNREVEAYERGKVAKDSNSTGLTPPLKDAQIETEWVEGRVQGNRYIEGHYEHIITEPTRWE